MSLAPRAGIGGMEVTKKAWVIKNKFGYESLTPPDGFTSKLKAKKAIKSFGRRITIQYGDDLTIFR